MTVIHDSASAQVKLAERNLAAECRAIEEGHHCRLDTNRHLFVVSSDTSPWQYALSARAVDGLVVLSCRAEPSPAHPFAIIPRGIQHHARHAEPGLLGRKHQALVARRLERAGLARFDGVRWVATPKAAELVTTADEDAERDAFDRL